FRLIDLREGRVGIDRDLPRGAIDVLDHVLHDGGSRPEEFPRAAIERVDDARLSRDAGDHLPALSGLDAWIDPLDFTRIGRNRGFNEEPFERVVEVPVIDDVLIVPD